MESRCERSLINWKVQIHGPDTHRCNWADGSSKKGNCSCDAGKEHGSSSIWKSNGCDDFSVGIWVLDTCILPFVHSDKDIVGTKGKDNKDSDKVQKGKEVKPTNKRVHKEGKWETENNLLESDARDEKTLGVNDNGNGGDGSISDYTDTSVG